MSRSEAIKVMVLAGGPDRERSVSLQSGQTVTAALAEAGYDVRRRDILPDDLSALDEFRQWRGGAIFPVLHGSWGEGGSLQRILDKRKTPYVGCAASAAELCMDKHRTKLVLAENGLPTPEFELLSKGQKGAIALPVVVKATCEGSSIDLAICRDAAAVRSARRRFGRRHAKLLLERFVPGKELTVGVVGLPRGVASPRGKGVHANGRHVALPPIHIVPATEYYDYDAKYIRDDTRYLFDIDLPKPVLAGVSRMALAAHLALGCRHMSRVDFIVDRDHRPWILEVNTIPGFTTHSLLPKAAGRAGIALPKLVDWLVRMALAG